MYRSFIEVRGSCVGGKVHVHRLLGGTLLSFIILYSISGSCSKALHTVWWVLARSLTGRSGTE